MSLLFNQASQIEGEVESLLDNISNSIMMFAEAIKNYLDNEMDIFLTRMKEVKKLETAVDELRREIRYKLYTKMLLPESRGDMLSLLETIDNVIDTTEEVLIQFDIQRPVIPKELNKDFIELVEVSCKAADFTVLAARSYIKNSEIINDYINKTYFYEHEADKVENRIKRKLFGSDEIISDLACKMHISKFVELIAKLSDDGQDVCERLSVATIKRSI
jgi:uncharacterized protein